MSGRLPPEEIHRRWLELLAGGVAMYPSVFDPVSFKIPTDIPPELGLGDSEVVPPMIGMSMVIEEDRALLIGQLAVAQRTGMACDRVCLVDGAQGEGWLFDLTEEFGVIATALTPLATKIAMEGHTRRELTARTARWRTDSLGQTTAVDPAFTRMIGWTLEFMSNDDALGQIHVEDRYAVVAAWGGTIAGPGRAERCRARLRKADGSYLWTELTMENHLAEDGDRSIHIEVLDISKEMEAAEEIRARERLLHRMAEAIPVGVVQIDADEMIVYANSPSAAITGRSDAVSFAEQFQDAREDDRRRAALAIEQVLGTGVDGDIEITIVHKLTAERRVCALTLRALIDEDGSISGAIVCVADVTDSASRRHELEVAATFDPLTGTYNRTSCLAALDAALHRTLHPDTGCAVVFIDLDDFKRVNDELGHHAGDVLLVETAQRLRAATRSSDLVGRFGGDEFVVVCADVTDSATAFELACRIDEHLRRPVEIDGGRVEPSASVGVAWASGDTTTADELLRQADAAMYVAKRHKAGGVHLWTESLGVPS